VSRTIAILGAGFAGLRAAILLGKAIRRHRLTDCRIVLVERNDFHAYAPLLYEVAASPAEVASYYDLKTIVTFPLDQVLGQYAIEVLHNTVSALDLPNGQVVLASGRRLAYDHLVIALGAETDAHGIAGLRETALGLKSFDDAIRIRDAIWLSSCSLKRLKIVIGGGGSTGVELAGELQPWLNAITREGRCRTGITLLQAGPEVLSGFSRRVVDKVSRRLAELKVKVLTDERIVAVDSEARRVQLESGMQIPYDVLIWTAGVRPSSILDGLPVQYGAGGRLAVAADMSVQPEDGMRLHGKVYCVGDAACIAQTQSTRAVPMTARRAISQATVAARNVIADIRGEPAIAYRPRSHPYIIPVGGKYAVAKIGPLVVSGFSAWLFKGSVELGYLLAILPPRHALRVWIKGIRLFTLNDRLG
jgi:NADH dehydrogenase